MLASCPCFCPGLKLAIRLAVQFRWGGAAVAQSSGASTGRKGASDQAANKGGPVMKAGC